MSRAGELVPGLGQSGSSECHPTGEGWEPAMVNTEKRESAPFGTLLLRLRAAAGLTQEQLAQRADLSPAAISALESGKRRTPRFATVELLAAALALHAQQRRELLAAARSTAGGVARNGGTDRDPRRQFWRSAADPSPLVGRVHELDL